MRPTRLALALAVLAAPGVRAQRSPGPALLVAPVHYDLALRVDYDSEQLHGDVALTVRSFGLRPLTEVPLVLYRLLRVASVADGRGTPLRFTQEVVGQSDEPTVQVNAVRVRLARPLRPGDTTTVHIAYGGYLLGYAETGMLYQQDRIDTTFTILRQDPFAYPQVALPSRTLGWTGAPPDFTYEARITVPERLTVANGGVLVARRVDGGKATYTYRSAVPSWRMDFAIARYAILAQGQTRVFHFPQDSAGAVGVARAVADALRLYTASFGPLQGPPAFTVIEVPDGWGSQKDAATIIQSAAAFRDSTRYREVYHEVAHLWGVVSRDSVSPRWDEGLATFLEYRTLGELSGRPVLRERAAAVAESIRRRFREQPPLAGTPLAAYGRAGLTDLSYSVGMLMFYVLDGVVGRERFDRIVGGYYQRYTATGATTDDFVAYARSVGGPEIDRFFHDWLFTAAWYDRVRDGADPEALVRAYAAH